MPVDDAERPLGSVLRELRTRRGLTGKQLADLTGISQPKISRIETGRAQPVPADVDELAAALGADESTRHALHARARALLEAQADWEITAYDLESVQQQTERLEREAVSFKIFQPALVVGLLQTSGYTHALLTALHKLKFPGAPPGSAATVAGGVSARVHRQAVLADEGKRFDFVMAEAVLSNRLCSREEMLVQLKRIADAARQPHVRIRIVPATTELRVPLFNGFTLLDDRHLFVEIFDTSLVKHGEIEAEFYANVFTELWNQAEEDIEPILAGYRDRYLRELTGDNR